MKCELKGIVGWENGVKRFIDNFVVFSWSSAIWPVSAIINLAFWLALAYGVFAIAHHFEVSIWPGNSAFHQLGLENGPPALCPKHKFGAEVDE